MENYFYCKRLRLYCYLSEHGFYFEKKLVDRDNPHYYIWVYPRTPELQTMLDYYFENVTLTARN